MRMQLGPSLSYKMLCSATSISLAATNLCALVVFMHAGSLLYKLPLELIF